MRRKHQAPLDGNWTFFAARFDPAALQSSTPFPSCLSKLWTGALNHDES
jgi:hypothetical protein